MLSWPTRETKAPTYPQLRAAGRSMFEKVIAAAHSSGFDMLKVARLLGLPTPGNVLLFDSETDINALADFCLAELRVQGRTLVETCDPTALSLTPREADHLDAFRLSRTSLFHAVRIRPAEHQVVLRDFLEPERPEVLLTDINLCASLQRRATEVLLFLRLLEVDGIFMSSGLFFLFELAQTDRLLQSFRQKMKKVAPADWSQRKFGFFYQKYKEWGEEQAYADVPPA